MPLAYGELFASLDDLVDAVDPDDFSTVVHELAVALGGRGPALRRLLENGDDVTTTLAERTEVFDALATTSPSLTHTIAPRPAPSAASFDNLALVTGTLAAQPGRPRARSSRGPAFGDQVAALLEASADDLGCTFADIGALFADIGTPRPTCAADPAPRRAAGATASLDAALVEAGEDGADGPYLGGSFVPEADRRRAPPVFARPRAPGRPAPLVPCAGRAGCAGAGADASVAADAAAARRSGAGSSDGTSGARPALPADVPPSSTADVGDERFPLGAVRARCWRRPLPSSWSRRAPSPTRMKSWFPMMTPAARPGDR